MTTDGVIWAPAFSTHEVFLGKYNHDTHLRMKRVIQQAMNAMMSAQAGINIHFPA
jgi:hypothetical protein